MLVRIQGADKYLYCDVDDCASDYSDMYDSGEECYEACVDDIVEQCNMRGYNDYERERVLSHYYIVFKNFPKWKKLL